MPAKETMAAPQPAEAVRKSATNWSALAKAGVKPVTVRCQTYQPLFRSDASCHSALIMNPDALKRHVDSGHGGGFYVQVVADGKPSPFWAAMDDSGLEAQDFRCEICDEQMRLPLHPSVFAPSAKHMRPHAGKTRRVYAGGKFDFCIASGVPEDTDEDAESAA